MKRLTNDQIFPVATKLSGLNLLQQRKKFPLLPVDYPEKLRLANRRVDLRGTRNTRDLGGYRTTDGSTVRWGVLYRSDRLSRLRNKDMAVIEKMNLYSVIDLRSVFERDRSPDRLPPNHQINVVDIPILDEGNEMIGQDFRNRITRGDIEGIDPAALLTGANYEFVAVFRDEYRRFLKTLLEASGKPVLWHCTSGKDRAGFASALVLTLLGVPEKTVFEDYLLTNTFLQPGMRQQFRALRLLKGRKVHDLVRGFAVAREEFLRSAFDTVRSEFGSFDAYIHDGLAISESEITQLKSWYLI